MNIPFNEIKWKSVNYIRKGESQEYEYNLVLNEPLASWDVFDYWEKERVFSMRDKLTKDDVLFDVGAEMGWLSLVYETMVNKIVLFEPSPEFANNIMALFRANNRPSPILFNGFLSDDSNLNGIMEVDGHNIKVKYIIDKMAYGSLKHNRDLPRISLDDYVKLSGVIPTALTIDVEGAESIVLGGALETLRIHKPKIWISVHPDLAYRDYPEYKQVSEILQNLGYSGVLLADNHEEHWLYEYD